MVFQFFFGMITKDLPEVKMYDKGDIIQQFVTSQGERVLQSIEFQYSRTNKGGCE